MMKRIAIVFVFLLLFSLAACKNEDSATEPTTSPTVASNATVTRTLPSAYITDDVYSFDAQSYAELYDYDEISYDDISDTFTLVMSGERYNQLVSDLFENIRTGVADIVESEYYPHIKDIQYTNDFGAFTLYVDRDGYLSAEDYTPEYIASFAVMYRDVLELDPKISFTIIDAADGSTLSLMTLPEE